VIAARYSYRVNAAGQIDSLLGQTWAPAGSMHLDDVNRSIWNGPFDTDERDLLRVMFSILCADRLSPRRDVRVRRGARVLSWRAISSRSAPMRGSRPAFPSKMP
jgi:hypothetical protein